VVESGSFLYSKVLGRGKIFYGWLGGMERGTKNDFGGIILTVIILCLQCTHI
jgi:hypothetical protein